MRRVRTMAAMAVASAAVTSLALAPGAEAHGVAGSGHGSHSPGHRSPGHHGPGHGTHGSGFTADCAPSTEALGYSDALDKATYDGATVGGLSSIAYDRRSGDWVSAVDNNGSDPARIWFYDSLADPTITRDPLVLRKPDGTPYDGTDSDNEGLAVLPDGDFVVSSETEPSIRIYDRDGVQQQSLPVPARFAVTGTTPQGQATSNATLEGLTLSPSGHVLVAAMEGALSGDVSSAGDTTYHRFLVYTSNRTGAWHLVKQVGYRTDTGDRVPEVAAFSDDSLLVEEAAYSSTAGNSVDLYEVDGLWRAPDVSDVTNLSRDPGDVLHKTLVGDLVQCPTLGAPAKETQANPLLDNFEGMAIDGSYPHGVLGVAMISDDNFSSLQTTRILRLAVRVPGQDCHGGRSVHQHEAKARRT